MIIINIIQIITIIKIIIKIIIIIISIIINITISISIIIYIEACMRTYREKREVLFIVGLFSNHENSERRPDKDRSNVALRRN